jgi:peptide/histidine transporter 3/4
MIPPKKYNTLNSVAGDQLRKKTFFSCQWRCFKQKGVSLILFWSCSVFVFTNYAVRRLLFDGLSTSKVRLSLTVLGVAVFFVCAWFLADVYTGRYRVIKACMLLMLIGAILHSLCLSLKSFFPEGPTHAVVNQIILTIICIAFGGFQANIIQFGMDQLLDSSTTDISSFIYLYVWTFFVGESISTFTLSCVCERYEALASLIFPTLLSLAVSSDYLFSNWLLKEPVTYNNPLKLIAQVLCYAARNKYPTNRSAFAYWDNERDSRLDLAANEYGGPFTKENVEDVKKFFQLLLILFLTSILMGMLLIDSTVYHTSVPYNFQDITFNRNCSTRDVYRVQCFRRFLLDIGYSVAVLFIPIWEVILFPVFWKCLMRLRMLTRHTLSMGVLFAYIVSLVSIEGIGERNWRRMNPNETHTCPISSNAELKYFGISYAWLIIPSVLLNLGVSMISIAGLEFIFAQSPYSMKGLIMNATYLMLGMAVIASYGLLMPFHLPAFNGLGDLGCVFWFLSTCGVVTLLLITLFLLTCSRYQNRQRGHTSTFHTRD